MRNSAVRTVELRRGREPGAAAHDGRSNDHIAGVGLAYRLGKGCWAMIGRLLADRMQLL